MVSTRNTSKSNANLSRMQDPPGDMDSRPPGTVEAVQANTNEVEALRLVNQRLIEELEQLTRQMQHPRVFGSTAYYHVKESKLDPRAKKALFMGVTLGVKGYRLWCLSLKKIISSRDVTFDESVMLKKVTIDVKVSENTLQQPEGRLPQVEGTQKLVEFQTTSDKPVEDQQTDHEADVGEEEVSKKDPQQQQDLPIAIRRPRREIRKPARFEDMVAYAFPVIEDGIPQTFLEANSSPDKEKWKKAMDEEMQSLVKNHTWKLARLSKGKKEIGCKWVYAQKEGFPSKNDVCYKARLVAKGYAQKEEID